MYFNDNGVTVPKNRTVIFSNGIIFFYISRTSNFNIDNLIIRNSGNIPFQRNASNFNDTAIKYDDTLNIRGNVYNFQGVVRSINNNTSPVLRECCAAMVMPEKSVKVSSDYQNSQVLIQYSPYNLTTSGEGAKTSYQRPIKYFDKNNPTLTKLYQETCTILLYLQKS